MTTYLDGNNIAAALGLRGPGDSRVALLNRLLSLRLPRPCVVVFDGAAAPEAPTGAKGALRVVFSGTGSADDWIAGRVQRGDLVVTRDAELGRRARDRQGRCASPAEFLASLHPARQARGGEKPEPGTDLAMWEAFFRDGQEP